MPRLEDVTDTTTKFDRVQPGEIGTTVPETPLPEPHRSRDTRGDGLQRRAQAVEDVANQRELGGILGHGEMELDAVDVFAAIADDAGDADRFGGEWRAELNGDHLADAKMVAAKDGDAAFADLSGLCLDWIIVVVPDADRNVEPQTRPAPCAWFNGSS